MGAFAVVCALLIPFFEFHVFAVLIWLLLFFGGSVLPPVTGIMLNSVEQTKRTSANSVANFCYNLLGYLPAPTFYGLVSSIVDDNESRLPMACLLYSTVFTISFICYGINTKIAREALEADRLSRSSNEESGVPKQNQI